MPVVYVRKPAENSRLCRGQMVLILLCQTDVPNLKSHILGLVSRSAQAVGLPEEARAL